MRHAASEWTESGRCTGWQDVVLSAQGVADATKIGKALRLVERPVTSVHTSSLRRSIETGQLLSRELGLSPSAIASSWMINEVRRGVLEGLTKSEIRQRYGRVQERKWRRSMHDRPPGRCSQILRLRSSYDFAGDRDPINLADCDVHELAGGSESLSDALSRALPYWHSKIANDLAKDGTVVVVTHGNLILTLLHHFGWLKDGDITTYPMHNGLVLMMTMRGPCKPIAVQELNWASEGFAIGGASLGECSTPVSGPVLTG